jgi:alpha-N-arabinofuranosidase
MYKNFGTHPVGVEGNAPQPSPKWPVGGDQPRINVGSPTYPLDIAAALTADRKILSLAIINATEIEQPLALDIRDIRVRSSGKRWRLLDSQITAQLAKVANVAYLAKLCRTRPSSGANFWQYQITAGILS